MTTRHVFAQKTFAHLASSIIPGSTSITLVPGDINYILPSFSSGTWLFLVLCDYLGHSEIVKVTALQGDTLTVERAQGGTSARTWYSGTLIMSRPIAAMFDQILQKDIFRSGAYNPNGVIAGLYIGEKFYQTGPADEQRRWWMYTNNTGGIGTGDRWRLIAGSPYGGEMEDDDGFYYYVPNWVNYSDPSYWDMSDLATWDAGNEWWDTGINSVGYVYPIGTWYIGKRWPDLYVMIMVDGDILGSLSWRIYDDDDNFIDLDGWGTPSYYSEEVRVLTWSGFDFQKIYADNRATRARFRIFANEGAAYDPNWQSFYPFNNTYWTATVGSWNGSSWDMAWNGSNMELKLTPIGGWAVGLDFQRFYITGTVPGGDSISEARFNEVGTGETVATGNGSGLPEGHARGARIQGMDFDELKILGNYHGVPPGGTWQITNIELLTEDIYL